MDVYMYIWWTGFVCEIKDYHYLNYIIYKCWRLLQQNLNFDLSAKIKWNWRFSKFSNLVKNAWYSTTWNTFGSIVMSLIRNIHLIYISQCLNDFALWSCYILMLMLLSIFKSVILYRNNVLFFITLMVT